jgi:hypothetical protein
MFDTSTLKNHTEMKIEQKSTDENAKDNRDVTISSVSQHIQQNHVIVRIVHITTSLQLHL